MINTMTYYGLGSWLIFCKLGDRLCQVISKVMEIFVSIRLRLNDI
jgi:hypothetical protein